MPSKIAIVALSLLVYGCGKDTRPCTGSKCSGADDMGVLPDQGADATADVGSRTDVEGPPDVGDASVPDVSADASTMTDAGMDIGVDAPDMTLPPPAASTFYAPQIPMLVRGAEALAGGLVVVGTTPPDFEANESREAVAFHTDAAGNVVWSARFGDPSNDQFLAVARRGATVVTGGVSRGYSVTNANNNDALLVRIDDTGLGSAFSWGTPDDELLFGLFDGGTVAEWIGVGEYAVGGGERDALVVAFDANLQPLWASAFDAGSDDYLTDGVVIGDTVFVVGNTGPQGARRAFMAAVTSSAVNWAQRSVSSGALIAATLTPNGQEVAVAGGLSNGTASAPVGLRLATDGSFTGRRFALPTAYAATNTWFSGTGRMVVTGALGGQVPFLMTVDSTGMAQAVRFDAGIATSGFLPTPIVSTSAGEHVVLEGATQTALDVPFSLTPEASCASDSQPVTSTAVPTTAFEAATITRTDLTFGGGPIVAPRTSAISVTGQSMLCGPP